MTVCGEKPLRCPGQKEIPTTAYPAGLSQPPRKGQPLGSATSGQLPLRLLYDENCTI